MNIIKIGVLASFAVVFVTFIVLMHNISLTGNFTYSAGYKQYSPDELCAVKGCVWDLEVQRGMAIASPHNTPMVGCICSGDKIQYFPLLVPDV